MTDHERHVITEKRFLYRYPRRPPRDTMSAMSKKEVKDAKAFVQNDYDKWASKYITKWGVIGPDGHPQASLPKVSEDMKELVFALKVGWIVHRRRRMWETFCRNIKPTNILIRIFGTKEK